MNDQIAAIEAIAGNPVYVGGIPGSPDYPRTWATVRHEGLRVELNCPGATPEEAVASLFNEVCQ